MEEVLVKKGAENATSIRKINLQGCKYAFISKRKDADVYGEGNDFETRILNPI